ncbi:hypothetical protein RRG08_043151 [Elysia crispata]|uniref:Copper type II ascorbate-dependent monooxygenase C-terminal domain-containing protein n=1 Tax=Elysia crispata TaxID=231223 RepID=A0AAE1DTQ1_9GAST|nr:hypothetical protein RRG08_043151 [Elysia crispata]
MIGRSTYKRSYWSSTRSYWRFITTTLDWSTTTWTAVDSSSDFQDLVIFQTGQMDIEIPPGQSRVDVVGTCRQQCTNLYFNKPVYVISALNHMHYMGRAMKIELFRQGRRIADITNEEYYNYDSPVNHE